MRFKWIAILLIIVLSIWGTRRILSRFFPIDHSGKVLRIASFNKGGWSSKGEDTRQLNQFALIFEDGFNCEGTDTSFAAIREGDIISIRGYHDVTGFPFLNPEWGECDEAQLIEIVTPQK